MTEAKETKNGDLLEVLADKCSREILILLSSREYPALQISRELDIPIATVYRKLKRLQDTGLIQNVKTIINLTGNEEKYFRSAVKEVTVGFDPDGLSIALKKIDYSDKFVRLWKRLKYPGAETEPAKIS